MKFFITLLVITPLLCFTIEKEKTPIGIYVGNLAPDFTALSPKDSAITLSSLRGNVVLLDFWASWCTPCRIENKQLIKTVAHFSKTKFPGKKKKKAIGLKVFNISFDSNKDSWKNAIIKDQLNWPFHASELKGWGSEVGKTYQINSIPSNVLINAEGIIIARNLRGAKLDLFLENYRIKEN